MKKLMRIIALASMGSVLSISSCMRDLERIVNPPNQSCLDIAGNDFCWSEGI